ncbi:hypothetical protein SDC9_144901 [bioreactor metagenome]|uniref:Uncharacterized protein n=1 Tax=bioreactor metagenome TaxID=1076179 RepID=A0A645E788_9ZZZZ
MQKRGYNTGAKRRVPDHGQRRVWAGWEAETEAHDMATGTGYDETPDQGRTHAASGSVRAQSSIRPGAGRACDVRGIRRALETRLRGTKPCPQNVGSLRRTAEAHPPCDRAHSIGQAAAAPSDGLLRRSAERGEPKRGFLQSDVPPAGRVRAVGNDAPNVGGRSWVPCEYDIPSDPWSGGRHPHCTRGMRYSRCPI